MCLYGVPSMSPMCLLSPEQTHGQATFCCLTRGQSHLPNVSLVPSMCRQLWPLSCHPAWGQGCVPSMVSPACPQDEPPACQPYLGSRTCPCCAVLSVSPACTLALERSSWLQLPA